MIAKIQLLRDDGKVIKEDIFNAFSFFGWEAVPGSSILQPPHKLDGFCYLPVPPPQATADRDAFQELYCRWFGLEGGER